MQRGHIFRKGRSWFGRWWDETIVDGEIVRRQRCKKLADVCDRFRTSKDVQPLLDEQLKPLNEGRGDARSTVPVADYIKDHFLPAMKECLKPSTHYGYDIVFRCYIKPHLNGVALRDFRCVDATKLLAAIHRRTKVRRSQLRHCKTMLSAVFKYAKQQGLIDGVNPVKDAAIPRNAERSKPTEAVSLEEVLQVLDALEKAGEKQAKTAVSLIFFCGLRPGEARGARWEDYDGKRLTIRQSVWNSIVTTPKTEESVASIPVGELLRGILAEQYKLDGNPTTGWILKGKFQGRPLNLNNLARRIIKPVLAKVEPEPIPWRTWYALRRGIATVVSAVERDPNAAKALLRHKDLTTTLRHYDKGTSEAMERAVLQIERLCNVCATGAVQ